MKLYNHELEAFIAFLYKLKIVDYRSRMRTRFMKLLAEYFNRFKEDYMALIQEHAHLDEEGKPRTIQEDGIEKYDIIDRAAFVKAYQELIEEEIIIEETEERKSMLLSVKESVLHCGIAFEGEEQFAYDRWCQLLEESYAEE
ncbi:hypothetical protein K0T92_04905 [Paenibacillus oenotherae]|uniref:Uncharacterized protein n=1 Tax=Paenibacillus oenotherae TaxID=1435645 RepID=A0ABS7D3C5_9BACL|nr:hypothetical protein [Paenibacillus oenotherae]MBW7474072.1 hypothetical protein [Paenibacillus oenotherae]